MRIQAPLAVVTPTVDGDVLTVLARADSWFTVSALHRLIGARSAEGIRRALGRLVQEGIVVTQPAGRASLYRLNRDHLAAAAIVELSRLGDTLRDRIAEQITTWREQPVYAALFGSAARGDMSPTSDVDLFMVRPGEPSAIWDEQLECLTKSVRGWTGNDPRVLDYAVDEVRDAAAREPVLQSVADDGVALAGNHRQYQRLVGAR